MNIEKDIPGRCEQRQRPEGRSVPGECEERQGDQGGERKPVVRTLERQWASLVAWMVKNPPAMQETRVPSLGREDPRRKEMATHSSILPGKSHGQRAWRATVHGVAQRWTRLSD